jgi:hypothetical protein
LFAEQISAREYVNPDGKKGSDDNQRRKYTGEEINDGLFVVLNKINVFFIKRQLTVHLYVFFNYFGDKFLDEMPRVYILVITVVKEISTD